MQGFTCDIFWGMYFFGDNFLGREALVMVFGRLSSPGWTTDNFVVQSLIFRFFIRRQKIEKRRNGCRCHLYGNFDADQRTALPQAVGSLRAQRSYGITIRVRQKGCIRIRPLLGPPSLRRHRRCGAAVQYSWCCI